MSEQELAWQTLQLAFICSKLSYAAKSLTEAKKWADLQTEEFYRFDGAGFPIRMLLERHNVRIAKVQLELLDTLVAPAYRALALRLSVDGAVHNIGRMRALWHETTMRQSLADRDAPRSLRSKAPIHKSS